MTWLTRRGWFRVGLAALLVLLAIQVVPYGRTHTNPPVTGEPSWDAPGTRALARQACFDCHSNETTWPAYASVAPMSWLVQYDVTEGRAALNLSEWPRTQEEAGEAAEVVREGEMPPMAYRMIHAHARLSAAQRDQLARGLARTVGATMSGEAPEHAR